MRRDGGRAACHIPAGSDVPLLDACAGAYAVAPGIELRVVAGDSWLALGRGSAPPQRFHAIDDRIFVRLGARGTPTRRTTGG
jgi:hypothetical protein